MTMAMQAVTMAVATDPMRGVNAKLNTDAVANVTRRAKVCVDYLARSASLREHTSCAVFDKILQSVELLRSGEGSTHTVYKLSFGISNSDAAKMMYELQENFERLCVVHGADHEVDDYSDAAIVHPSFDTTFPGVVCSAPVERDHHMHSGVHVRTKTVIERGPMCALPVDEDVEDPKVSVVRAVAACTATVGVTLGVVGGSGADMASVRALLNPDAMETVLHSDEFKLSQGAVPHSTWSSTMDLTHRLFAQYREGMDAYMHRSEAGQTALDERLVKKTMGVYVSTDEDEGFDLTDEEEYEEDEGFDLTDEEEEAGELTTERVALILGLPRVDSE
jgi:hypothetical protein